MDLSLWEPPDDGYHSSNESNYNAGAVVNLVYTPDVIEEEFLNKRSCLQVLKIWIDKADEEILELKEDISMLKCQLEWDDLDWIEPCNAVLRERINNLDVLMQSLKSDISEDVQSLAFQNLLKQPENFAPSLHELLKPLLENYRLVESNQTEDVITSNHIANIHTCVTEKSGEDSAKLNEVKENMVPNSAHVESWKVISVMSELPDVTVKASTASTASSGGGAEIKTTDKEVLLKRKAVRPMLEHEETHRIAARGRFVKNKKPRSTTHLQQKHETLKVNQAKPISALTTVVKKEDPSGMDCESSSTTVKKSQGSKNVGKYTVNDLKTIAKNKKITGYSKLKKKELLELLGLEEELLDSGEQRLPKEEVVSLAYIR